MPKVSQTAFAEMLGTSRRAITTYETGVVVPSDTFIQLLCAKFNISEEWLRTGKEPMHKSDIEAQVDAYTRGYPLDAEEREIIRYFLNLKPPERAARPQESTQTDVPAAPLTDTAAKTQRTMTDEELEAEVEAYRAALIAEKEAALASSSTVAAKMA